MKKPKIYYSIRSNWLKNVETPKAVGDRFLTMLDQLGPLSPLMRDWVMLNPNTFSIKPLNLVAPRMEQWTESAIDHQDDGSPDQRCGYQLMASSGLPEKNPSNDEFNINITGGALYNNSITFEFGSYGRRPASELITYPLFAGALKVLVANWDCPWAFAKAFVDDLPPLVQATIPLVLPTSEPIRQYNGAWIAYLSAPLVAGLTPPPEIIAEPTPGGGLILSAALERLDPLNPDHARRSEMLRQILEQRVEGPSFSTKTVARVGPY